MKKDQRYHEITTAAGIAFALAERGNFDSVFSALEQITQAATNLAAVECEPGFAWNEDGRTDWESACTIFAIRIEEGKPLTIAAARRIAKRV